MEPHPRLVTVVLSVSDLERTAAFYADAFGLDLHTSDHAHRRAVDAGAEVLHPPRPQPWGRSARYRDPDGNVVELTCPT